MLGTTTGSRTRWSQVAAAAATQNLATGLVFGSFGTLVLAIEQEYGASRTQSSMAISVLVVTLSLTASILGRALETASIRAVMASGAALSAAGFVLLSFASDAWQLLACYALVLGPATAMLGIVPSMTLAARWSGDRQRGLAMGLVNAPLLVMIVPLAIVPILEPFGIRTVYRVLAAVDLCAIPLILALVQDRPAIVAAQAMHEATPPVRANLLGSPVFWIIVVANGILVGAGMMKLAHFIPLLTEMGRTFDEANLLLAISGGAGMIGSFAFGALADRIGGTRALAINGFVQAVVWTIFLAPVAYPILLVDAVIVGACGGGVQAAFGAALVALFGQQSFSRALGLMSLFTLPFIFGLTPAASLIYQASGAYFLPMGLMVAALTGAGALFLVAARFERRSTRAAALTS